MKISIREVGDAKIVTLEGDVDLGTSPVLRSTLFETLPGLARLHYQSAGHPVYRQLRNRHPH